MENGITIAEFKKQIKPKLKVLTKNQLIDIIIELASKYEHPKSESKKQSSENDQKKE